MNSDEFKGLTPPRMAFENVCIPPHPVSGIETQGQWAVKHIVSLGSHCLTSWTLKKFNLKKISLPFDWIFSCPAMVIDCLRDDFQTFLDKNEYSSFISFYAKGIFTFCKKVFLFPEVRTSTITHWPTPW
ncbi:DUF1796 family putative cysteine peptidase [Klebsiella quasipneumoniae]|uniref:DUF1796 family putative cysteine peptidase n=1 Tax=Klebsiella quasipneumoniae TaxID=1463165 RepID=UPI002948BE44|nr:DUF1796 family putative cysteine peptidase [Klebsiella quasipneumoniae]